MRRAFICLMLTLFVYAPALPQENEAGLIAVFSEIDFATDTTRLLLLNPETREEIVREFNGLVEPTHIFWAKGYNELALSYDSGSGYGLSTYDVQKEVVNTYVNGLELIARDVSPDESQLLYTLGELYGQNPSSKLFAYDRTTDTSEQLTEDPLLVFDAFWSPDGKTIAFNAYERDRIVHEMDFPPSDIYLIDRNTNHITNLTRSENMWEIFSSWSPDGSQIAYTVAENEVFHVYVADKNGRNSRQMSFSEGIAHLPKWALDGTHLVYYWIDVPFTGVRLRLVDLQTGAEKTLIEKYAIDAFDLSPDGKQIAYTSREYMYAEGKLCVFDITSESEWCARTEPYQPNALVWGR
jgi:Tol biopolymer transport system component